MDNEKSAQIDSLVRKIPKVELHLHLEGAIPLETLYEFYRRSGGSKSSIGCVADLRTKFEFTNFEHFVELWTWKNTLIQNEADFEQITYDVLRNLSEQNVKYVEPFYSPGDYWRQGFRVEAITESVLRGRARAEKDFGIGVAFILDLIRDHGPERGANYLERVSPYIGKGVIGIGIGGSEHLFPAKPYAELYRKAHDLGLRLTAHAGEVLGPESIYQVIDYLHVERIGHGARACEDPDLVNLLQERQIPLELCVQSNIKTGVFSSVEVHPIRDYFSKGLLVTVNSDDPTMFNTTISQEYGLLLEKLNFTLDQVKQISLNGVEASFLPLDQKEKLKQVFSEEWDELRAFSS